MPTDTQVHYNKQYLEEEIRQLATIQQATLDSKPLQPISPIIADAKDTLVEAYRVLARAAKQNRELSSAGEWLIDNFYIIQEQMVQLNADLPESYYRKLPRLVQGEYRGYPRTFEIVQMLATISDNTIDQDNTTIAVRAYQEIDTLSLAEMWSVPLMNRLALIVRLAERAKKLLRDRRMQDEIEKILHEKIDEEADEPGYLLRKLSEIVGQQNDTQRFLVILAQQLQKRGMLTENERRWFDYKFSRWETNLEEQLRGRTQQTSRLHLSIQNAISSLRVVSETDWADFVESCSVVERILRLDPADMYHQMDFSTRDTYRKKVEKLSAHSNFSEQKVAEQALLMAESAAQNGATSKGKKVHIGYYLVGDGYEGLIDKLKYNRPFDEWVLKKGEEQPAIYFSIIGLHLVILLGIVGLFTNFLMQEWWMITLTLLITVLPALDLSIVSTNRLLSFFVSPRILPKLEFKDEIPHKYRTVVIVPTMLSSPRDVADQFEALEIRALANTNPSLQFALLADFHDAPHESMQDDSAILEEAQQQVNRLNLQYKSKYGDKFLFFHRKRRWNEEEDTWMGWERKRGKLEEFNHLLKNPDADTTYSIVNDNFLQTLTKFPLQFVITLDADTKLPPGSARMLIGTAAHPLNRAEVDKEGNIVERGYGIFQPRISIAPKSANRTWFARIFSGNVGLDPYTTAVSDIYQDLFGEGIFTGKGLYDLAVFEQVLGDKFPENAILSHDLLESTYLRAALVTDIELFDAYPRNYLSFAKRNHRWIRGDWQILYWLFTKVPARGQSSESNPISGISKWKIFDNMRRSLNPVALIIFLLAGWVLLPGSAFVWTAAVFGILAFPIYSSFSTDIFRRPERVNWKLYIEKIRADLKTNTLQAVTSFLFLPHQAAISLDAIIRTLYRMFISQKKMLEWTTANQAERLHSNGTFLSYWLNMWFNIFWGIVSLILVSIYHSTILIIAIPVCLGWILAPGIAFYLTRTPEVFEHRELPEGDVRELRGYARRTWHFFEQYMNAEHSWLPPDNVQEDPYVGPVGRTSPTNIGLALVSIYVAYEMGYITFSKTMERLQNMLDSLQVLDRYRGHFYNWYSTKLGEVLSPSYVSTVDSGNLAGSLLVIQQALEKIGERRWPNPRFWDGLEDTLMVIDELLDELQDTDDFKGIHESLVQEMDQLKAKFPSSTPSNIVDWRDTLKSLADNARKLSEVNLSILQEEFEELRFSEWKDWLTRPYMMISDQLSEIEEYSGSKTPHSSVASGNPPSDNVKHNKAFAGKVRVARELGTICRDFVQDMDFSLLYNADRELFSIGFNVDRSAQDSSYYDLLASEARLASFIAIAKGEVPPEHWFRLSRRLTSIEQNEILLSWGGTMFEYLMPLLFMSRFDQTLLSNTYENVVTWQRDYGSLRNRPWGFSESGYAILNLELHYQYRAFGVPGLGLRRGLAEDYVVAPYAGMLALMVQPSEAMKNLRKLKSEGAYGANGFYEAIDYTSGRTNNNGDQERSVIKMYMAHHQGMSLLSMVNILQDNLVQHLFHDHPLVRSCELLLQERIPRGIPIKEPRPIDVELEPAEEEKVHESVDHVGIDDLNDTPPRTHILSNGRYSTLITHAGTGYSVFDETMLTRWRSDVVQDQYGLFFYVRDLESGKYWSVGHQPVRRKADRYDSWFHAGKVQTARVDDWIESFMEVCVSPEDDIELRKIALTNYSDRERKIELTSYAEVVLNTQQADMSHPAFSSLFVQTEYVQQHHSVLARRRPRESEDEAMWLVHTIASEDMEGEGNMLQVETDRSNFIGRNRSLQNPRVMDRSVKLSGTVGNVKDPILSLRCVVTLAPGEKKNITFGLGRVNTREEAVKMGDRYDNPYSTDRVFELASIYGSVEMEQINISSDQANYFQQLAGHLIFNSPDLRASEDILKRNRRQQPGLWAHSISGDVPILVYHIEDTKFIRQVELLLKAHTFWHHKGLKIDLVFMNDHPPSYADELQEAIHQKIQFSSERQKFRERGGIFVIRSDELSPDERTLIDSVASVVLKGKLPSLNSLNGISNVRQDENLYHPVDQNQFDYACAPDSDDLKLFNGYGGFTAKGQEYVIRLCMDPETQTMNYPPSPWINVIANPDFGFITSEKGSGYTWSQNSRENKLTPWSNDAVLDPTGEAIYIRDEKEHIFWSPLPEPVAGSGFYEIRHGFGYSTYCSKTLNVEQDVRKWVSKDESIKFVKLRLSNTDLMSKKLSIFRYVDWVLGVFREESTRYVHTSFDSGLQAVFARNHYNNEFAGRLAFSALYTPHQFEFDSFTANRQDFIGRNRSLHDPKTIAQDQQLSQEFGIGFESCAASQITFNLDSGKSIDLYFLLGEAEDEGEACKLIEKYRSAEAIDHSFDIVKQFWKQKFSRIQVKTPLPEFNYLANGWLQYQNIACRIWGRTGFYQAGGAFGFRDQLQDSMAACYLDPELTRKQILLHARHQFMEGDVLHWWHPPTDRGIRSRITDDLLWLPYVTDNYIRHTGDSSILKEELPFVTARQLKEHEHEAYLQPETTEQVASLYEHCCRAIDRSLTVGDHGLPLIGAGDWNDGMNKVGIEGKGESIWLGFFLYDILESFIPICKRRKDEERAQKYSTYQQELKQKLNSKGWDGEWYLRAYYDDGTPLGSSENDECCIDAIAQSWSVISGAGTPQKIRKALQSADEHLVSEPEGIIRLLTPAFDKTEKNPGYIKGYIPGVRENGGQYTHAALWLVKAFAESGNRERAAKLLQMLTPVNHTLLEQDVQRYNVEPYAVAADIYGEAPLTGMGGWTWYTGSAGWMYRVMVESVLGFQILKGNTLRISPFISPNWKRYSITIRRMDGETEYNIMVVNSQKRSKGTLSAQLDGNKITVKKNAVEVKMTNDGNLHELRVEVGD